MNISNYLPVVVDLILKSVVLLTLAGAVAWAVGHRVSAANRHVIWLAVFGQLLALPFVTAGMANRASQASMEEPRAVLVFNLPAKPTAPLVAMAAPVAAEPISGLRRVVEGLLKNWRAGVVVVWLGGVSALLVARLVGAGRLRLLRRRSLLLGDARISASAMRIAREQGLRRRVELRTSEVCRVAMTWGTLRPVVMLPAEASTWSDARLDRVLRHELAHVARGDCLVRLASQLACALYWPNPLVWLAARRLRLAQEQACDDRVLAAGVGARAYASELLRGARVLAEVGRPSGALAMAEPSTLEKRILGIVDHGRVRGALRRRTVGFTIVAAGLALGGCAAVQVRDEQPMQTAQSRTAEAATQNLRQVEVEATFIRAKADQPQNQALLAALKDMPGYVPGSTLTVIGLSPDATTTLFQGRAEIFATELITTPKVTVLSGNRAQVSVMHELSYPADLEAKKGEAVQTHGEMNPFPATDRVKDGVALIPGTPVDKDDARRNIGAELDVLPRVLADGRIALSGKARDTSLVDVAELAVPSSSGSPALDPPSQQPTFSVREGSFDVVLESGETVLLLLEPTKPLATPQIILVFVTATDLTTSGRQALN